jgi:hypothetical protein
MTTDGHLDLLLLLLPLLGEEYLDRPQQDVKPTTWLVESCRRFATLVRRAGTCLVAATPDAVWVEPMEPARKLICVPVSQKGA